MDGILLFDDLPNAAILVESKGELLLIKRINKLFINNFLGQQNLDEIKTDHQLSKLIGLDNDDCQSIRGLIELYKESKHPVSIINEKYLFDKPELNKFSGRALEIYCSSASENLFLLTFIDFTSRIIHEKIINKQTVQNRKNAEIINKAEEISKFGTWELDLKTNILKWSDGVYNICEIEPNEFELNFETGLSIIHPEDRERALAEMQNAIKSGSEYNIQKRFLLPNGKIKDIISRGGLIKDDKGNGIKLFGVFQDISEQVGAEKKLAVYNSRFKALIDNIEGVFWEADPNTFEFLFVSKKVEKIFGFTAEEWLGSKDFWLNHIVEKDKERVYNFCKGETLAGRDHVFRYQMYNKSGQLIWIEDFVSVVLNSEGKADKLYGLMFDITSKIKEENELITVKNELEEIYDQSLDIICAINPEGEFLKVNEAFEFITGFSKIETIGKKSYDFVFNEDIEDTKKAAALVTNSGRILNFENRYVKKDGSLVNLSWSAVWNEKEKVFYAIGRDVTDRLKSELEMKLLLDNTEESFVLLDKELNIVSFNNLFHQTYKNNFGIEVNKGDHILKYAQADRINFLKDLYNKVLKGEKFENEFSFTNIHKQHFIYNLIYKPALNKDGEIIGVFVSAFDITEKKHALNSLQESEKRYSNLFKFSPQIQLVYSPKRKKFIDANPSALLKLGYSLDRLLNTQYDELFKDKPEDELLEKFAYLFNENKGENFKGISLVNSLKSAFIAEIYKNSIIYQGEVAEIILANDISDSLNYIRAIEKQNKQLSEIAWVQSHKVRAPLSRMMGLINLLRMEGIDKLNREEIIEFIIHSAEELDAIIKEITVKAEIAGLN